MAINASNDNTCERISVISKSKHASLSKCDEAIHDMLALSATSLRTNTIGGTYILDAISLLWSSTKYDYIGLGSALNSKHTLGL